MPIVSLAPAGSVGLVLDQPSAEISQLAWTAAEDVRFDDGQISSIASAIALDDTMPMQGNYAIGLVAPSTGRGAWAILGAAKASAYLDGSYSDITRAAGDYTGTLANRWCGTVLGGLAIFTNGVDVPQSWAEPNGSIPLVNLANWPAGVTAPVIRAFKQYLIALDVTKSAVRYPTLVKWSHPADPGTVPASWDETDPTKDAGEYPLSGTFGACVDAVPLRDNLIIYKEDSVWGMQEIGGTFIFRFFKIFGEWGIPYRDCAVEFVSGKHFAFTGEDLVVHDGQSVQSVAKGRVRKALRAISEEQKKSCFVVVQAAYKEVWFCYRDISDGGTAATKALCWNWTDNTFSSRTLDNYYFIQPGKITPASSSGVTWATATGSWAARVGSWSTLEEAVGRTRMFAVGTLKAYWLEASDTEVKSASLQRDGIGVAMRAQQPPDMSSVKFLTRIWPRFTGTEGDTVQITLGASMGVGEVITWAPPQNFRIGVDRKLDYTLTGKLFAIKISTMTAGKWTYSGMDAEVQFSGRQ